MPLDRRITVHIEALGEYVDGVYQPGEVTDYGVWAQRTSAGAADVATEGGIFVSEAATFLVRWFRELALTPPNRVSITDELGLEWNVDVISESNQRRRFLGIQALREGDG